jgi:hypothetical protein
MGVIGQFDEQYFKAGAAKFMTRDEETSGVIHVTSVLNKSDGASYFMFNAQVHTTIAISRPDLAKAANIAQLQAEAVEGGQYYLMKISDWNKVFAG